MSTIKCLKIKKRDFSDELERYIYPFVTANEEGTPRPSSVCKNTAGTKCVLSPASDSRETTDTTNGVPDPSTLQKS